MLEAVKVSLNVFWKQKMPFLLAIVIFTIGAHQLVDFLTRPFMDSDDANNSLVENARYMELAVAALFLKAALSRGTFRALSGVTLTHSMLRSRIGDLEFWRLIGRLILISVSYGLIFALVLVILIPIVVIVIAYDATWGYMVEVLFLLCFVLVIVWITIRYFLVIPVSVNEKLGVKESFSRSRQLSRGHGWDLVRVVLFVFVPAGLIVSLPDLLSDLGVSHGVLEIAAKLLTSIFVTLDAIISTVCYVHFKFGEFRVPMEQLEESSGSES